MNNLFKRFAKDESGATAIEYGLIAAIMAVIVIAAFPLINDGLTNAFTDVAAQLDAVPGAE